MVSPPALVRQEGWRGPEKGGTSSPGWDKASELHLAKSSPLDFVMTKALGLLHSGSSSPPSARDTRGSFWDPHHGNLEGFLGVNPKKCGGLLSLCPLQFFTFTLVLTQPPAIHQNHHLSVPSCLWLQQILLPISRSHLLYPSRCPHLLGFQGGHLSCDLSSLMGPRKLLIFSLSSFFL